MKKLISLFLLISLFSNLAFADCDWKTGIIPGPNKTFIYSEACHQAVGALVQSNTVQTQQIKDLTQAIQLKDLALTSADKRTQMWTVTAENEQDRMVGLTKDQSHSDWLFFSLGVATTVLAGFMTARLIGH
jgi:hypothetical protein